MSTRSSRRAKRAQNANPNAAPNDVSQGVPDAAADGARSKSLENVAEKTASSSSVKNAAPNPRSSTRNDAANAPKSGAKTSNAKLSNARAPRPLTRATVPSQNVPETAQNAELSPRVWRIAAGAILFIALLLRFWHLDLVPFHHDEGVNGNFLDTLFRKGDYKYNPTNFHGPTLYYFALFTSYLNTFFLGKPGFNEIALRGIPAGFGVGVIALVLSLRRTLGTTATLSAAALLTVSPGMVYVSRYFIHEMHFAFFTLLAVVAMRRFRPRGAWWWPALLSLVVAGVLSSRTLGAALQNGGIASLTLTETQFLILTVGLCVALMLSRPLGNRGWVFVAAVSLALLFGSKETAPISVVVLLFAGALTWLLCNKLPQRKLRSNAPLNAPSSTRFDENETVKSAFDGRLISVALGAALSFWIVIALFFSSFHRVYFTEGMSNFFSAYDVWRKTGESDFQAKPLLTYLIWMLTIEPMIFLLGFAGVVVALKQRRSRFSVFVALWASGIFVAYSLIPYKTPWLMINFVLPLALLCGIALQSFGEWTARRSSTRNVWNWKTAALAAPFLLITIVQMSYLNFVDYDNDDTVRNRAGDIVQLPKWQIARGDKTIDLLPGDIKKYPYIYVHTQRGYLDLLRRVDAYAVQSGLGTKMPIAVMSDEYWPLPWSLRNYGVGYYGKVVTPTNEVVILGRTDPNPQYSQDAQLTPLLSGRYVRVGEYPLRPSVTFSMWVRRDLAGN